MRGRGHADRRAGPGHHRLPDLAAVRRAAATRSPCRTSRPASVVDLAAPLRRADVVVMSGDDHAVWPARPRTPAARDAVLRARSTRRPAPTRAGGRDSPKRACLPASSAHDRPLYSEANGRAPGPSDDIRDRPRRADRRAPRGGVGGGRLQRATRCARSSQRYRTAYADELARWQELRDELDAIERGRARVHAATSRPTPTDRDRRAGRRGRRRRGGRGGRRRGRPGPGPPDRRRRRSAASSAASRPSSPSSRSRCATSRSPGSSSSAATPAWSATATATLPTDVQMRIVEAQESERSRLAQEVHDGPAQVLSNAIFQVEYIERVIDTRPASRPDGAALPARPAPARARLGPDVHQPAPPAGPRRARPRRRDRRRGRPDDRPDGPRDQLGAAAAAGPADRHPADGRPARPAGSTAECAQARRGLGRHGRQRDRRWRLGPDRPRRRPRVRRRSRRGPWPAELRTSIHARARGTDRCPLRGAFTAGRWHARPARDPGGSRGDQLMSYRGPERRRGGPDRRARRRADHGS